MDQVTYGPYLELRCELCLEKLVQRYGAGVRRRSHGLRTVGKQKAEELSCRRRM